MRMMDSPNKKLEDADLQHTMTLHSSQKNPGGASQTQLDDRRNSQYVNSYQNDNQQVNTPGNMDIYSENVVAYPFNYGGEISEGD